jgi:transcriptional regulator with XRE-family HTH domain
LKDSSNLGKSVPAPDVYIRLRRERELRSWSQGELAEKVGASSLTVSRWERGMSLPTPQYRQQLCEVFGKSAQELGFIQDDLQSNVGKPQVLEVNGSQALESIGAKRRVSTRFSRNSLYLLLGIILVLGVTGTSIVYFVKKAVDVPPPVKAVITNTPQTLTSPTLVPVTKTYPPSGAKLVLNDPLQDNSHGYNWDESGSCAFTGDGYHVSTSISNYTFYCAAFATDFSNFTYEVQMKILKGYSGGIIFRADADNSKLYYFSFDQQGNYLLTIFTGHTSSGILAQGTSSVFHTGFGQPNLIVVVANADHLSFYVNHTYITNVSDDTFHHGQIGIAASTSDGGSVEAVFNNVKVWKI